MEIVERRTAKLQRREAQQAQPAKQAQQGQAQQGQASAKPLKLPPSQEPKQPSLPVQQEPRPPAAQLQQQEQQQKQQQHKLPSKEQQPPMPAAKLKKKKLKQHKLPKQQQPESAAAAPAAEQPAAEQPAKRRRRGGSRDGQKVPEGAELESAGPDAWVLMPDSREWLGSIKAERLMPGVPAYAPALRFYVQASKEEGSGGGSGGAAGGAGGSSSNGARPGSAGGSSAAAASGGGEQRRTYGFFLPRHEKVLAYYRQPAAGGRTLSVQLVVTPAQFEADTGCKSKSGRRASDWRRQMATGACLPTWRSCTRWRTASLTSLARRLRRLLTELERPCLRHGIMSHCCPSP